MKCPICEGAGEFREYMEHQLVSRHVCGACRGGGKVSLRWIISHWFWNNIPVSFFEWYVDWRYSKESEDA